MKTKTTKTTSRKASITRNDVQHLARVKQLAQSARATLKENDDASTCAVLRALAKKLKTTGRGEFMEVFTGSPFKLSQGTVSRQFYLGRHA